MKKKKEKKELKKVRKVRDTQNSNQNTLKINTIRWLYKLPCMNLIKKGELFKYLHVMYVKVNPSTGMIDDDMSLNTLDEVWIEFGFPQVLDTKDEWKEVYSCTPYTRELPPDVLEGISKGRYVMVSTHDVDLDTKGKDMKEALNNLMDLIKEKFNISDVDDHMYEEPLGESPHGNDY